MTFKVGDPVMIQTKDLRLKVPSRKTAPRFIGPFRVKDVVGPEAYRLWLPSHHKFHPVFNVSRLERYLPRDHDNPEYRTDSIEVDGEEQWEVDRILDRRTRNGTVEYLVRWVGFGDVYNQWVARKDMRADELIAEFENVRKKRTPPMIDQAHITKKRSGGRSRKIR